MHGPPKNRFDYNIINNIKVASGATVVIEIAPYIERSS